jgi:hypothetical protein
MHPWRFGLAGAAALALTSFQAVAQTPEPPLAASTTVLMDPRLPAGTAAAIAGAAGNGEVGEIRWLMSGGDCGAPPGIYNQPGQADDTARFDLDTALRAGAKQQGSSILVVAGGPSDCLSIACALAASLKMASPSLQIDVLALSEQAQSLQCLASNTGGQFRRGTADTAADTAAGMLTAQLASAKAATPAAPSDTDRTADSVEPSTAQTTAAASSGSTATAEAPASDAQPAGAETNATATPTPPAGGPPIPRQRPDAAEASADIAAEDRQEAGGGQNPDTAPSEATPFAWAVPPPGAPESEPRPTDKGPGVQIRILAGPSGPLVKSDLLFEILSPAGDGTSRQVVSSDAINPYFALRKGEYIVRVAHGDVVREFPFAADGERVIPLTFSLDIGYVSLRVRPTSQAAPLESGISYQISKIGGTPNGAALMRVQAAQPMVTLPAGRYRIVSQSGNIKTAAVINVEPGATIKHDFKLRLGYLRLTVPAEAQDVTLQVEAFSTAGTEQTKVLASAKGSTAMFRLQEGNYIAVAAQNGTRVTQIATITQGKLTELSLDMPTAAQEPPLQE